ncbi:MAG: glycosyltransferase family 39 protein [Thermoanaerobaculia bacterium]
MSEPGAVPAAPTAGSIRAGSFLPPGATGALGLAALAVVVALRALTLAPDTWEWDEILFGAAARNGIDVRVNHPHAPGFPLFVLPARLLVLLGATPFGATLGIAAVAGVAAAVLVVLLARELGAGQEESLWAGIVWACVPAVWLHSVRPLSDAPGAAAFFLAALLVLRASRVAEGKSLVAAALAVGAAFAVRPHVALALLPISLFAARDVLGRPFGRRWAALAAGAGVAAGVLPYVPVVAASGGVRSYLAAAHAVAAYVQRSEAPSPAALITAAFWERWLVDPFGGTLPAALAWIAAVAGAVLAPRAAQRLSLAFGPLLALSVVTLNPATAPRYGLPLFAAAPLAASLGLTWLRVRRRRLAAALAAGVLLVVALPAVPAIVEVARRPSPPVAAMNALRTDPALAGRPVLLEPALRVHWAELGPAVPWRELERGREAGAPPGSLAVTHDSALAGFRSVRSFRYESGLLGKVSRARYLSVTIQEPEAPEVSRGRFKATADDLLSSVDEPIEGSAVREPLRVRGWCQERGGVVVVPVEFRVDGRSVVPASLVRTARPDVAAAIPGVGDASRAGYEAVLPPRSVAPGRHVLEVVFETEDRRRVYPPRTFRLTGDGGPKS